MPALKGICRSGAAFLGLIENGAIAIAGERIAWVGREADLPAQFAGDEARDLDRPPGHAGADRLPHPYRLRRQPGRASSRCGLKAPAMRKSRGPAAASSRRSRRRGRRARTNLLADALTRVDCLIAEGVATIEIKSGYGLDHETELKMLRVARAHRPAHRPVRIVTSFLGAHAVPAEYAGRPAPISTKSACPRSARRTCRGPGRCRRRFLRGHRVFAAQIARVFKEARALGLPVKLHAEQLSDLGGAALAARRGALSADHLEYTSEAGVAAMAEAGTVAVLLPGAFYTLRETPDCRRSMPLRAARRADGGRHRLQPRLLAADLAAAGDEHGLHAVPPDAGGGACRRHPQRRPGARPCRLRNDRSRAARRSGGLGRRRPGRARLSHRLQPAACALFRRRRP